MKSANSAQDKIDIPKFQKIAKKYAMMGDRGTEDEYELIKEYQGNKEIQIFGNTKDGFIKWETNVPKPYYQTYSEYYPNGNIKTKGVTTMGGGTHLGVWIDYDNDGKKINEVNNEVPARKFTYQNLLDLMLKEKVININASAKEAKKCCSAGYNQELNIWYFSSMNKSYMKTHYEVNAETGKIISQKTKQSGYE